LSRAICERLMSLPEFVSAETVLFYAHARSEVQTLSAIERTINLGKRVATTYCDGDDLVPVQVLGLNELEPGAFAVPEPLERLRGLAERRVELDEIDLVVVPGVAFDRGGGRLGHGKGFYDRFLGRAKQANLELLTVGLAYECQFVDEVPSDQHDVRLNWVASELATFVGSN